MKLELLSNKNELELVVEAETAKEEMAVVLAVETITELELELLISSMWSANQV
jgi:hypothetical protein